MSHTWLFAISQQLQMQADSVKKQEYTASWRRDLHQRNRQPKPIDVTRFIVGAILAAVVKSFYPL